MYNFIFAFIIINLNMNLKKTILISILSLFVVFFLLPSYSALANDTIKITPPGGDNSALSSPENLTKSIINYVLGIVGLISVVVVIYGGFLIQTSGGKEDQRKKGIQALTYALIGLVIALAAFAIVNIVGRGVTGN